MFVAKEKLVKHLNLPGSMDAAVWPHPDNNALAVANAFAKEVGTLKPNLCFIHFRDVDSAGHRSSARSAEKIAAFEQVDSALGIIRDAIEKSGLADSSVIIISADHGSHDIKSKEGALVGTHGTPEAADVTIPWIAFGKDVRKGCTITSPIIQYDTAATALWLLGVPIPEHFWGRPVTSAFDIPKIQNPDFISSNDESLALRHAPRRIIHPHGLHHRAQGTRHFSAGARTGGAD